MQKDWDFVTMADYSADMAESSERAAEIIKALRERAERAERVLAEVVLAAGGKVKVYDHVLHDPRRRVELTTWRSQADMTIIFEARR